MDNLCFGMEVLNITQLPRGDYSHANQAVDLGGKDTGKDFWFARGDTYWKCTCCWSSGTNTYHFLSCDKNGNPIKVHCADGVDRIITISLTHDLNAPVINKLYHNEKMYQEGTKYPYAGRVTGNHIHLEIAEGDVRNRYKAPNGTWTLYNELNPLQVMYVDDSFTTIKNTMGAVVKHCSSVFGGKDIMTLRDGFQVVSYKNASLKIFKAFGDYNNLRMLSAKGDSSSTQDIKKFDHSGMVIVAETNANYFEMANQDIYGQHYGVEQSDGDGEHTTSLDLAPKNSGYLVVYQDNDGKVNYCTADKYWLSKKDVLFACSPYSIVVWDKKIVNEHSSAFGNKDNTYNSQTMIMRVNDIWHIVCTASKVLPSTMRDFAMECDADIAFLMDSGGSTQMMAYVNGKWGSQISSSRALPNTLALVYIKKEEPSDTDKKTDGDTVSRKEYELVVKERDTYKNQLNRIKEIVNE